MKNIYLCDDDEDDREFFQQALSEVWPEAKLYCSINGEDLLVNLQGRKSIIPDIIFLDINMPRKDGIETLHDIKSNIRFRDIPVIILTTSSNRENINATFCIGANRYVIKPGDFNQLKNLLRILINEKVTAVENVEDYVITKKVI
jgi:CheY-like chemotaxis protein